MKLIPLLLCLLVWHEVNGSKNKGDRSNSRLLKWVKNGALALTINYAMNANVNSNANAIACPFVIPESHKMEKMYWITCAQKETDLDKYFVQNPEECLEVQTLYNKVKTWVKDKCYANQPKSFEDAAVSSFKREKKKPSYQEHLTLFGDYLKGFPLQDDTTMKGYRLGLYNDEKHELMEIAKRDNEFDFFAMRSAEKLFSFSYNTITALKKALDKYKSADYEQKIQNFKYLTNIYPSKEQTSAQETVGSKYDTKNFDQVYKVFEFMCKYEPAFGYDKQWAATYALTIFDGMNFDQLNKAFEFFDKNVSTHKKSAAREAILYVSQYQDKNFDKVNNTFEYMYANVYPGDKWRAAWEALSPKYDDDIASVQVSLQQRKPSPTVVFFNYWQLL